MAQVKIYGLRRKINSIKLQMSDVIHSCLIDSIYIPEEKRFHRFIMLEDDEFIYPSDRSSNYTILEIMMFSGRSEENKNRLIELLFERFQYELGIGVNDLEINIIEIPINNWGIRGVNGSKLKLNYQI